MYRGPEGAAGVPEIDSDRSGVRISNVKLMSLDGVVDIGFDIAWNGSWRRAAPPPDFAAPDLDDLFKPPNERCADNWDAAWVFVKYQATEVLPLARSPKLIAALAGGDADALRSVALDGGAAPDVVNDWFGGNIEISPTQKGERWSVMQERMSPTTTSGPPERTVDYIEIVRDLEARPARFVARRQSRWQHAHLSTANADHRAPPGARLKVAPEGTGAFVYRSEDNLGEGPVRFTDLKLRWRLRPDEVAYMRRISLWVFGIEMVYVPEGIFFAGDPLGAKGPENCFYDALKEGSDRTYEVDSEAAIDVGGKKEDAPPQGKRLYYDDAASVAGKGDQQGPIPAAFPKGFQAFYVMKRQITQGEYADFINTLKGSARTARFPYWTGDYRYAIFWGKTGDRIAMRPARACNWLSWLDGVSFAAWAGLRPMTELEYEKACRGPLKPVSGEYAWGDTTIQQAQVIVGIEDGTESVNGNASFDNFTFLGGDGENGPLRDDAFATSGNPNTRESTPAARASFLRTDDEDGFQVAERNVRRETGRSYYGVMALSGNLWELCVTVGKKEGRAFSGRHGRGELSPYGAPDCEELGWPGADAEGVGFRGGSWYTGRGALRVADRTYASGLIGWYSARSHDLGFRCVRTAPDD